MASLKAFYQRSRGASRAGAELDGATLSAILGHVVIPIFVLDRFGKVALWNAAVEKLTGLAAREVLGTKQHWRGFYRQIARLRGELCRFRIAGRPAARIAAE